MSIQPPFQDAAQKRVYTPAEFTQVLEAIRYQHLERVQRLIETLGPEILTTPLPEPIVNGNFYYGQGIKPITIAAVSSPDVLNHVLSVTTCDDATGLAMFNRSVSEGFTNTFDILMKKFTFTPAQRGAALKTCCGNRNHKNIAIRLIKTGPDITDWLEDIIQDDKNVKELEFLLDSGLDPDTRVKGGPLINHVLQDKPKMLQRLLEADANTLLPDDRGRCARMIAFKGNLTASLQAINEHNLENTNHDISLLLAGTEKDPALLKNRIDQFGAHVLYLPPGHFLDAQSPNYVPDIPIAQQLAQKCSKACLDVLLSYPLTPEGKHYILHGSLESGDPEKIAMTPDLIAAGADPIRLLRLALSVPGVAALNHLIKAGVSVETIVDRSNSIPGGEKNPLITDACLYGRPEHVRYLLDAKVRLDVPNSAGLLPAQVTTFTEINKMIVAEMVKRSLLPQAGLHPLEDVTIIKKTIKL